MVLYKGYTMHVVDISISVDYCIKEKKTTLDQVLKHHLLSAQLFLKTDLHTSLSVHCSQVLKEN